MAATDLAERLRAVLGAEEVVGLVRLSGGASRETWAFDAVDAGGASRALVLQRQRPSALGDIDLEARVLIAARQAGVPAPEVVAWSTDVDVLGAPFTIVARVEGETIARRILRDAEFAAARPRLAAQFGRAAAALRAIDPGAVPGLPVVEVLGHYRSMVDELGQPHPTFELAFRWLEANRPDPTPSGVVHGDFRLGNVIVGGDGLRAVIDWELAHVGEPLEDLGWMCVKSWRYRGPGRVAGVGDVSELLDAYEEGCGVRVDPEVLRWWEVFGTLKWGVLCIVQADAHLSGASRSARAGRDRPACLRDRARPVPGAPVTAPHDAPTTAELVEAVREWLERDVMPATEGRLQFHARVAVNVLAMVEREIALGPEQEARHRARLAALGVADDAELAARIRAGEFDDRYTEVRDAVRASVRDKLAVANPRYLDE